jgi:hypothetical protein
MFYPEASAPGLNESRIVDADENIESEVETCAVAWHGAQ